MTGCERCCVVATYSVSLGQDASVPVVYACLYLFGFLSLVIMVVRVVFVLKKGMERGHVMISSPILVIRDRLKTTAKSWILPWYVGYAILLSCVLLVESVLSFAGAGGGPVITALTKLVEAFCQLLDNLLLGFLILPRITFRGKLVVYLYGGAAFIAFALFLLLYPPDNCPWCSLHYTSSRVWFFYLISAVESVAILLWAFFRPFKYNPRPAAILYSINTSIIYTTCVVTLKTMDSLSESGGPTDWGYCVLIALNAFYYLFNAIIVYRTIIADSKYVIQNGLDDALVDDKATDEEREQLLSVSDIIQHKGNSKLVEILSRDITLLREEDVHLDRIIGSGAFGDVFHGEMHGVEVAVKKLRAKADEENVKLLVKEVKILSSVRHPNCVLLIGLVIADDNIGIVTEFCSNGSLWDVLHRRKNKILLTNEDKLRIARDVCSGMAFLHSLNYIHRDLKSPNILMSGMVAKVGDFGYTRKFAELTMTALGTVAWSAPEVLARESFDSSADVYSFGVVLWEILGMRVPFEGIDPIHVAVGVLNGSLSLPALECSKAVQAIIDECLDRNPRNRPSFAQLVARFEDFVWEN